MGDFAIRCHGIGKQYAIGARPRYRALRDTLTDAIYGPFRLVRRAVSGAPVAQGTVDTIWALRDINLDIRPGEVLGVVGKNGAGKSTLLKILSRITAPTEGAAELRGRVGSLLEIATGFHPELTGRENIYLNGAILGMKRREIDANFDAIVGFAECDKFLDTAVKHYSSGMYVRLAFAVAAHLDPEIMLVDEVLAVGDADFQKKCLGRMNDVARSGRTVLFVSHNMVAVEGMCSRVICLHEGRIIGDGSPDVVIPLYLREAVASTRERIFDDPSAAPGDDKIRLHHVRVRPDGGSADDPITVRTAIRVEFEFWNIVPAAEVNVGISLYNEQRIQVFTTDTVDVSAPAGLVRVSGVIPGDLLNDGMHAIEIFYERRGAMVFCCDDVVSFEVLDSPELRKGFHLRWTGIVRPRFHWTSEFVEARESAQASIDQP